MGIGERIIGAIRARQDRRSKAAPGAIGRFHREIGKEGLYRLPIRPGGLVIDAGGYQGEWAMRILARYGCRVIIFEPVPQFAERLADLFAENPGVSVRHEALGRRQGLLDLHLHADGTSAFRKDQGERIRDVPIADVATVFQESQPAPIACLKLNIEGGEYDVLERLIETGLICRCENILVQFHSQPADWSVRLERIEESLARTHRKVWGYPLVWDLWSSREPVSGS